MGYMGFGMRKEVYTRKPKIPFEKLRKLYKTQLPTTNSNNKYNKLNFTKAQVEETKLKIRKKIKRDNIIDGVLFVIIIIILLIILYLIVI